MTEPLLCLGCKKPMSGASPCRRYCSFTCAGRAGGRPRKIEAESGLGAPATSRKAAFEEQGSRIIHIRKVNPEMTAADIARRLGIDEERVGRVLRAAGLVKGAH